MTDAVFFYVFSALVLGGAMGIGKDTIIEPVKHAIDRGEDPTKD